MFVGYISRKKSKQLESILSLTLLPLCIRFKLLVLFLEIFVTVYSVYTPCAVRKLWIWHLVLGYGHPLLPTLSSNQHHCVFSSGVLHNFRKLLNSFFIFFCKVLLWCDIRKKKSFSGDTAGLLRPLFMFSNVCLVSMFLFFFLCTYYAVDLILGVHKGFGLWKSPEERTAPHLWMCICNALLFCIWPIKSCGDKREVWGIERSDAFVQQSCLLYVSMNRFNSLNSA